jgi:hypothetical protein
MRKRSRSSKIPFRRTRRFRDDNGAVGGMIEELPAFTVVIISLAVFIATSYNASIAYGEMRNATSLGEDASSYLRAFRSYEDVLERGTYSQEPLTGQFDPAKLDSLNTSALRRDLNPRHPFNVTVRDVMSNVTWSFGERPPDDHATSRVRESTAAVVALPGGERHPALLTVVIW